MDRLKVVGQLEAEDLRVERELRLQRPSLVLGLAEAMALALEEQVGMRQTLALQRCHDGVRLRLGHDKVISALQTRTGQEQRSR